MEKALTLGEVFWLISQICIIVFLAALAIAVLIWWILRAFDDKKTIGRYKLSNASFAETADEWMNKYYAEKREHADSVDFYSASIVRRDKKIESLVTWDEKKSKRIIQLENQLKENGIEPEEWDYAA